MWFQNRGDTGAHVPKRNAASLLIPAVARARLQAQEQGTAGTAISEEQPLSSCDPLVVLQTAD